MLNAQLFETIAVSGVTGVVLGSGSVFAILKKKGVAKDTVYASLKEFGITPNANQEKLIDDAIEAAVLELGHNKTEEEKQAEKQELKAKLDQVTAERDTFKQTIDTITSAATAVNSTQSTRNSDTLTTNTATPSATNANTSQLTQTA